MLHTNSFIGLGIPGLAGSLGRIPSCMSSAGRSGDVELCNRVDLFPIGHADHGSQTLKDLYKTAYEIRPRVILEMAAERAIWIDQSQSLNIFLDKPSSKVLSAFTCQKGNLWLKCPIKTSSVPASSVSFAEIWRSRLSPSTVVWDARYPSHCMTS